MHVGLTRSEVEKRQKEFGLNVLAAVNPNPWWKMLFAQFTDFLILILIGSAAIAIAMGIYEQDKTELIDGAIIFGIVLLNAGIGFFQEFKTDKALLALKKLIAPVTIAIRDGHRQQVKAEDIVPDDVIVLNPGDRIVADGTLIEVSELLIDEAALTGESVSVHKKLHEEACMGTTVTSGFALMRVKETGMNTKFGRIARLTEETVQDISPLQKEMFQIGVFVTKITLILSGILILTGYFFQGKHFLESLLFAVSVAVAAVPEGLPATVTIALALGVQKMVKKNAVVKKLSAVETLGATTVICSDKTGTLTKNEMTVTAAYLGGEEIIPVSGAGYDPNDGAIGNHQISIPKSQFPNPNDQKENLEKIRWISSFCTEAELIEKEGRYLVVGDPTEGALLTFAAKQLLNEKSQIPNPKSQIQIPKFQILHKLPFDSIRKMMSIMVENPEKQVEIWTKGSPDEMIDRSTHILEHGKVIALSEEKRKQILAMNEKMANDALRVIAFAYRPMSVMPHKVSTETLERDLVFLGMVGMIDPPREEVSKAVGFCHRAGIRTIIITGDHGLTAKAIAKQIGIADDRTAVILGAQLDAMPDSKLDMLLTFGGTEHLRREHAKDPATRQHAGNSLIFSRVTPEHKRRIVDRLKILGEVVAVTGDGVNDAPALKRADLGIAMGITGTEVSKETANMILLDDSFASIVEAVHEGRKIYANLRKFTWYIFSTNFAELFTVFTAIMLGLPPPITAALILAVNVGTDVLPAIALGVDHPEPDAMNRLPRHPKERIMNGKFIQHFLYLGILMGVIVMATFYWKLRSLGWHYGDVLGSNDPVLMETSGFVFAVLVMIQLFNSYNARSFQHSIFRLKSLWHLWGANLVSVLLVLAIIYVPILQRLFHTLDLPLFDWAVILGAGASVIVLEEIRKWLRKQLTARM